MEAALIRDFYGVTTRACGNMKDPAARAAALERAGLAGLPAFYLRQVHGCDILRLSAGSSVADQAPDGDGWITDAPGLVLCVFVADCMPLFLWEASGRAAGVFHCGWRGACAGMPRRAVEAFKRHYGIEARDLRAFVGPSIGPCCYRVGPEMREKFHPDSFAQREGGLFLDLGAEARRQLLATGLPVGAVSTKAPCTCCSRDEFFSFRRDKQDSRMLAFISLSHGH